MNAVVRFSIARPKTVIAIWIVLAAICVPLMIALTGALKAGGFDNPRGEAAAGQKVIERSFNEAPESLQVVLTKPDGDVTADLAEATRVAEETPHVASVQDYRQDPKWLSADRHTTFLQLGFRIDKSTIQHEIDGLRERMTEAMRDRGVQVRVTGAQALDYDLSVQSEKDAVTAEMIAFPLLIVVLLVVFRSVGAMLLPIVVAGLALVVASAIGYLITFMTDLSTLYTNAVSLIGIAVAVDYSLFIIKRYRDELVAGDTYVPALRTAMRTAGHAVLFSGLAVVVALLALFIPRIMVFSSMAIAGVVVTLVALAMSMTLLPAALTVMGRRINWLSLKPRAARTTQGSGPGLLTRLQRKPALTLAVLVAIFGVMAWPMSDIRLQSPVASATILPEETDSRQGIERLQAALEFRNLFPVQIVVSAPESTSPATLLDAVRKVNETVREQQGIDTVTDVTSIGLPAEAVTAAVDGQSAALPPEAKAGFDQLWGADGDRRVSRVVVIPSSDPDSDAAHDLIHDLRDELPGAVPDGVRVQVTGATATGVDFDEVLINTLPAILIAVALITIALLARAFRSWLLPLLALALNALVVAASLGLLTTISQNWLDQRIDSTTPALVFAIMFGLSMDYMVIMISRMREHYVEHGDHHAAVTGGLRDTAGLVNGAALIMVAVFASFLVAKVSVVQQLGLGLGIAVILDAVVIRLLVMPAALNLIGPRVWGRAAQRATGGERSPDAEPVPAT
ncbi:putative drug exporter of the RND superfamily [Micromonospora pallida]|uniref:Putative drug exporter of the RND superfamily n=1 Tax=Micromonospora pallida TaxID=145854 RepID=A0A1C6RIT1_9ACTN|nr:MMPL family transporter [Micromonospora pallida]SCL17027.1 putative drug exporter of the RND superfamily [Micromonospora pallida]